MIRRTCALATAVLLTGCALTGAPPLGRPPTPTTEAATPAAWQAPLPHGGSTGAMLQWWAQFDDPVLPRLIEAAQAAHPTLAGATARVAQARAEATVAGAALLPRLDLQAQATRGRDTPQAPLANVGAAGAALSWEIDLFGGNWAGRQAAQSRLRAAQADWHDARILVAAEIARQYLGLRACEAQADLAEADERSRAETARLTELLADAGLQSPGMAALARASAAQARSGVVARRASCQGLVKLLTELTALPEPALREQLAAGQARLPTAPPLPLTQLPATLLAQRPDMAAAAEQAQAAADAVAQARAQRLPRLQFSGSFFRTRVETPQITQLGPVWSVGPLQLNLPLFDGGRLQAGEDAALAAYDLARAQLLARARAAVREVELALVDLDAAARRQDDLRAAAADFRRSLQAAETRQRAGLASLFELEDARRSAVQADAAWIDWQREQALAWVALYRALGGGWQPDALTP